MPGASFSPPSHQAFEAIDAMHRIHAGVEQKRGYQIPDWAYRDVLYMLIYYSIAAYELLEHNMSETEKEEVYRVFCRVGLRMGLTDLPPHYPDWLPDREAHLRNDLKKSDFTDDLFRQYRKHLGLVRFNILLEAQKLVVPQRVSRLLQFTPFSLLTPFVPVYKSSRLIQADHLLKAILLPPNYKQQIQALDVA